ncbi:HIT domain-containing protein [Candidatus Falkowbacteria bacterium]|nr:HIT domain-containing protein [Candidatus Falkowbacteria bacterium]
MRILVKNRAKYWKRKIGKTCDFCNLSVIKDQEIKKLSGKHWWVIAAKFPYLNGNIIIIPKRHVVDLNQLTKDEDMEFPVVLKKSLKKLGESFKTKSFNITLNLGPDSGCSLNHIHWQIVPRQKINPNSQAIFNGFVLVTMDYKDLKKKLNK